MDDPLVEPQVGADQTTIQKLRQYLAHQPNTDYIFGVLCSYVRKAGIVSANEIDVREKATELLSEIFLKARELADKYQGQKMESWLLRIAANLVKQEREKLQTRNKHIVSFVKKHSSILTVESVSEETFLNFLPAPDDVEQNIELKLRFEAVFAQLSLEDQKILKLSKQLGYSHEEIARKLNITPGTSRVRTMRAIDRFRAAWEAQDDEKRGESDV